MTNEGTKICTYEEFSIQLAWTVLKKDEDGSARNAMNSGCFHADFLWPQDGNGGG